MAGGGRVLTTSPSRTPWAGWPSVLAAAGIVAATFYAWTGLSPELWADTPAPKADSVKWRTSMAFADTALTLLSAALLIGPLRVLRGGGPAIHLPLRRRIGLTAAALAAAHLVVGLSMHSDITRPWSAFATNWPSSTSSLPVPLTVLALGNWFGLGVALALAAPVATSNRRMVRRLAATRWKHLQRMTYVAYVVLIGHVVLYQKAERRWVGHRAVILSIIGAVVVLQITALVVQRRRAAAPADETKGGPSRTGRGVGPTA